MGEKDALPSLNIDRTIPATDALATPISSTEDVKLVDFSPVGLTMKEYLAITICHGILAQQPLKGMKKDDANLLQVQAFFLHLATIDLCSLPQRHFIMDAAPGPEDHFLRKYCEVAQNLIQSNDGFLDIATDNGLCWDLLDMIDGRVYSCLLSKIKKGHALPSEVVERAEALWNVLTSRLEHLPEHLEVEIEQAPSPRSSLAPDKPYAVFGFQSSSSRPIS